MYLQKTTPEQLNKPRLHAISKPGQPERIVTQPIYENIASTKQFASPLSPQCGYSSWRHLRPTNDPIRWHSPYIEIAMKD